MFDLTNYLKSSFPLLYCETYEIKRASSSMMVQEGYGLYKWDSINGLDNTGNLTSIPEFLEYISNLTNRSAIIAENFNFFFEDESVQQMLLNYIPVLKNKGICIVVIGSEHPKKFPNTLKKYIHTIEFPMPTVDEFKEIVKSISEQVEIEYDESIAEACIGLTYEEAENALYKSVVDNKKFDKDVIYQMKGDMLKSTGFMKYMNPEPIENIGGLNNLKQYIKNRLKAYDEPELNLPKLKAIFLVGVPGCLTGDTLINVCRKQKGGGYKPIRLDTLYYRFNNLEKKAKLRGLINNTNKSWDLSISTKCHSFKEKEEYIGFNNIENVIYSGIKEVYKITTNFGFSIKSTEDHKFLTTDGYVPLKNLKKGDKIYTYKVGELINNHKKGRNTRQQVQQVNDVGKHPNARKKIIKGLEYTSHPLHRLVVEANMNGLKLENFLYQLHKDILGLNFLNPKMEVHHKDKNRRNNTLKNLQVVTKKEHCQIHIKEKNLNTYKYFPRFQKIKKIEYIGKEKTYDIQMSSPNNNFVANGFVVHNSGKSQFAKALASIFDWPLIECDVNAMKGGMVGETEENTRLFCKTVDTFHNAVILLDELSLAFGGYTSGSVHETGGATSGMLGTLLTWMNDRTSPAIIIATSNDLNLPQAMLRAGRWSALFFIDFPSFNERKEIVQIMNKKWNSNLPLDDDFINSLAEWSGAEIEQLAKDSLFEDYKEAAMGISLVRETKAEQINEIRKFGLTIRKANSGSMTKGLLNKKRTISIKDEPIKKDFGIDEDFKSKISKKILNKES